MRRVSRSYVASVVVVVAVSHAMACGADGGAPLADAAAVDAAAHDASRNDAGLPARVSRSPDGMGYCCEPERSGSCSFPRLYVGGFGVRPEDCLGGASDAVWSPTTRELVDAHGCVYLDTATVKHCMREVLYDAAVDAGAAPDAGLRDGGDPDAPDA